MGVFIVNYKKHGMILESLEYRRGMGDMFSDDMLGDILGEEVEFDSLWSSDLDFESIDEAKAVTFGNKSYPKNGWALVMAGGAGSGKGSAIARQILLDGKILDVDQMKSVFSKISATGDLSKKIAKYTGGREFDFKNEQDVMDLHAIIGVELGLDKKKTELLLKSISSGNFLNNIIFDITGKSSTKLMNIANSVKRLGYKASLVWVVTNRQVAMLRNLMRSRVVGERLFHEIHNQVNDTLLSFIRSDDSKDYDEAWILFSSDSRVSDLSAEEQKNLMNNSVFKLKKSGSGFEIGEDLLKRIVDVLGPNEISPEDPKVYKEFAVVKDIVKNLPMVDKEVGTNFSKWSKSKDTGVELNKKIKVPTYRDLNLRK